MSERETKEKTLVDSRLFRAGLVVAAAGWLINSAAFLNIGLVAIGGAWATKK